MGYLNYALKRFLLLIPVLLGVTLGVFLLLKLTPGDPVRMILPQQAQTPENIALVREQYALDEPLVVQYTNWLFNAIQGDLGRSFVRGGPVTEIILTRLWPTTQLAVVAFVVSTILAIPTGILGGVYKDTWVDHVTRIIAFSGISIPSFWLGIMVILVFSLFWKQWFGNVLIPPGGYVAPSTDFFGWLHAVIGPGLTLGVGYTALTSRLTRSAMVDVLNEDYVRTARSKGVKEATVILLHAFKNALIPIVTMLGLSIAFLFNGSIVVEEVFRWPGIGRLLYRSVLARDMPMIQGLLLFIATVLVFANLAVDLLYAYLDPRIKYD